MFVVNNQTPLIITEKRIRVLARDRLLFVASSKVTKNAIKVFIENFFFTNVLSLNTQRIRRSPFSKRPSQKLKNFGSGFKKAGVKFNFQDLGNFF